MAEHRQRPRRLPSNVETQAAEWRSRADQARHTIAEIKALPVTEAAQLIRDHAARATAERIAGEPTEAASQARAADWHSPSPGRQPSHERDFGPSL